MNDYDDISDNIQIKLQYLIFLFYADTILNKYLLCAVLVFVFLKINYIHVFMFFWRGAYYNIVLISSALMDVKSVIAVIQGDDVITSVMIYLSFIIIIIIVIAIIVLVLSLVFPLDSKRYVTHNRYINTSFD